MPGKKSGIILLYLLYIGLMKQNTKKLVYFFCILTLIISIFLLYLRAYILQNFEIVKNQNPINKSIVVTKTLH